MARSNPQLRGTHWSRLASSSSRPRRI